MHSSLIKTPVYQQLNKLLRDLIRQGEFPPGAQFLTERQICERFGVSRATANKALSNLVAEGLLAFKKGVGTFVRDGVLHYDTHTLVSFTEKALAAGKTPSTQLLALRSLAAVDAPEGVRAALHLANGDTLHDVERLRLADGIPVIYERRYIVARFCPQLTTDELEGSLYALWRDRFGLEIAGADEVIRAVILRGVESRLLGIRSGAPGFQVRSTGFLTDGSPLWWEETWYRGDLYEFRNHLGPLQSIQPPGRVSMAQGALRVG
jgi:GntR family transcriptional regulator